MSRAECARILEASLELSRLVSPLVGQPSFGRWVVHEEEIDGIVTSYSLDLLVRDYDDPVVRGRLAADRTQCSFEQLDGVVPVPGDLEMLHADNEDEHSSAPAPSHTTANG